MDSTSITTRISNVVLELSSIALIVTCFIFFVYASNSPGPFSQSWAQYSPYFPVNPYKPPPHGCAVTQANILADPSITQLQRHGARFPTALASVPIRAALSKLQSVPTVDSNLAFLANFTYDLGTDDLVPLGTRQSQESGSTQYQRYSHLVSLDNLPFVRASSSERVVRSAMDWNTGFSDASKRRFTPTLSVILSDTANDTLKSSMCPLAGKSTLQTSQWLSIYAPPIASRLNSIAPGAGLNEPTSTVSFPSARSTLSRREAQPFCGFSRRGVRGIRLFGDLNKYYGTGTLDSHQRPGPHATNRTLDSSPTTFPLDRTIYADFSHDNQMIAIYAALGRNKDDGWKVSKMVPFSGRMVVEKLACDGEDFVRILVDDAVQPLAFCGAVGWDVSAFRVCGESGVREERRDG
ncbi:histidine phosphatase superfamily [Infundibulicybe gibba]|nr:histidine phosphatase superfamily [Infundibulicybe gibba]